MCINKCYYKLFDKIEIVLGTNTSIKIYGHYFLVIICSSFKNSISFCKNLQNTYIESLDQQPTTSIMGLTPINYISLRNGTHSCSKSMDRKVVPIGKGPPVIFKPEISKTVRFGGILLLRISESCGNSVNLL